MTESWVTRQRTKTVRNTRGVFDVRMGSVVWLMGSRWIAADHSVADDPLRVTVLSVNTNKRTMTVTVTDKEWRDYFQMAPDTYISVPWSQLQRVCRF